LERPPGDLGVFRIPLDAALIPRAVPVAIPGHVFSKKRACQPEGVFEEPPAIGSRVPGGPIEPAGVVQIAPMEGAELFGKFAVVHEQRDLVVEP
jgi:hypothetical protein